MSELAARLTDREVTSQLLDELVDQITERLQAGEALDLDEYARQYPELEEQLRKLLPGIQMLAHLGYSPAETEGLDANVSPQPVHGTLGDYRILHEIGRGGMGVVYQAEQVSLGRKVALKILPFAAVMDRRQLQRFQNEARAAASLKHPNIVQVYAVGCERAVHYYAMEYVEGETLAELIRHLRRMEGLDGEAPEEAVQATSELAHSLASGRFAPAGGRCGPDASTQACLHEPTPGALAETARPPQAVISTERSSHSSSYFRSLAKIGVQLAEALDHAHQHGVIHRDIKPSNVILDHQGKPWITDFGLARWDAPSRTAGEGWGEVASLTVTGDLLGTVRYMSPEQALAKRIVVDHRTDIYSLGVTLYELLTLHPAFRGQDRQELLRQIAFEEPTPPRKLNKSVPNDMEIIVLKAMAKNPAERYDTAQELADDLERFLEFQPIRGRRPTLVQRAANWSRRHQPIVWSATVSTFLLLVFGLVGLGIGNVMIRQERDAKDRALKDKEKALADKYTALAAETAALGERNQALLSAEANLGKAEAERQRAEASLQTAEAERQRAEGNLDQALAALDLIYLWSIGDARMLGKPISQPPGFELLTSDELPPFSDLERELLKRGLKFYDWFARQNAHAPRASLRTARAYYRVGLIQGALGDAAAAAEAYRGAVERFERLTKDQPHNAEHFRQLAEAYRGLATVVPQWDAAKELAEKSRMAYSSAIELKPNEIQLYLGRAMISEWLDPAKAAEDYEKSLGLDPHHIDALLACSNFYRSEARGLEYAERAVARSPDNPKCHLALAEALSLKDCTWIGPGVIYCPDPEPALKHYARAIELAPNSPRGYAARGKFYRRIEANEQALEDLNRALELEPTDRWASKNRGIILARLGQFDKALADLEAYHRQYPHDVDVHRQILDIHLATKNWQSAVESITAILEYDPPDLQDLRELRIEVYLSHGRYDEALAECDRCVELEPEELRPAMIRAEVLAIAGRTGEYRQACRKMLEQFSASDDAMVRCHAARVGALLPDAVPDPAELVKLATSAESIHPSVWTCYSLGMARLRAGQWDKAAESFEASLNQRFKLPLSWLGLALVHHQRGDTEAARQWLHKAVQGIETRGLTRFEARLESRLLRREVEQLLGINGEEGHDTPNAKEP